MSEINNRIDTLFREKKADILSVFFTAGYPGLEDTVPVINELVREGVDLIEIGIPFSDPLADGPVIQDSSLRAIRNGMNIRKLFDQIRDIRTEVNIPLVLMGYLNPVYQYGVENFCRQAHACGIDGVILPDLPIYEFAEHYKSVFEEYNLHNIFLISPQTPEERIRMIDQETHGFIYMVSSSSITGAKNDISDTQVQYFERIKAMNLSNPALIGFGISNKETYQRACRYAHGAIIGSAFIKAISEGDLDTSIQQFINTIRS